MDSQAWFGACDLQSPGRFEDQVCQVIGRILAVLSLSAEADILELGKTLPCRRQPRGSA